MNIWVATQNAHKVQEISAILSPINVKSFLDLENAPEVEENGNSYAENATIKAKALYDIVHEPVFADDSGLEVDALDGKPGIHSARFSGPDTNHARNVAKMLDVMKDVPDGKRTARFRCCIIYIDAEGESHEFNGTLEGSIAHECHGEGGFGYDPIFFLPERKCTIAELSGSEKNTISHRAFALEKLKDYFKSIKLI
mgnify:CR=1 FL=1